MTEAMGWTATASWDAGTHSTSSPSQRLLERLLPYRMSPEAWRTKISTISQIAFAESV